MSLQPPKKKKNKESATGKANAPVLSGSIDRSQLPTVRFNPNERTEVPLPAGKTKGEAASVSERLPAPPKLPGDAPGATTSGASVCYLCNRKFKTPEMLSKHEQQSDLHKVRRLVF